MKDWKYIVIGLLAWGGWFVSLAQPVEKGRTITSKSRSGNSLFRVGNIYITGNRVTKAYVVERELSFKKGDSITIPDLVNAFQKGRERLINTHLFNEVLIYLQGTHGFEVDVEIDLKERWYIFPLPYFRPVDRNLAVWQEHGYSLSRVNYGLKYTQYNFSGRNDNLVLWFITGYARQFQIAYDLPEADKNLRHGFGFTALYSALREVNAFTADNQQYFIDADTIGYSGKYLSQQYSFLARYYFRPALKTKHIFRLGFSKLILDSAVLVYNPDFLSKGKRQIFYPEFSYSLKYTDVDYIAYPLRGINFEGGLVRKGLQADMNLTQLYIKNSLSWPLAHKTYFNTQAWGTLKLPLNQPFYNQQMMGYGDFYLRGLDKYVVDGELGGMVHNTFMRELFNFDLPFLKVSSHDHIPFRIYATVFGDAGYVYNKNNTGNTLENIFLYTGGVGIDIVSFYDFTFKFDYALNQLGQKGLFLRIANQF